MNIKDFNELWRHRAMALRVKFAEKHNQYGTDIDVFENNEFCATLAELSPEQCLIVCVSKHIAVLAKYARMLAALTTKPISEKEMAKWRESMDDISIWMYILNGLLEERFQSGQRGVADDGAP